MDAQSLRPWLVLCRAPGLGSAAVRRLLAAFPDLARALAAGAPALRDAGLSENQIEAIAAVERAAIDADLAWLAAPGRRALTLTDPEYPPLLHEIAQPPPLLFVQGDADWLALPQIAIVGARNATPQGIENAQAFAAELARRGLVVTSGLALGIDGAAHRGALAAGGGTIAVCATGLDRVYPARHKALAHEIAAHGALVSEFPPGVGALAEHFPRRNRIISGLALGVLVVEAARESGSLITARFALEQGREVFAIPGSIHNPLARGCHALIRQGAKLVETVDDVLEELGPVLGRRHAPAHRSDAQDAPPAVVQADVHLAAEVLHAIGDGALAVDELAARIQRPLPELQVALTQLELAGAVAPVAGGRWQRLHRA
ncbi:DNA protecting protein DprA [Fontimonas thermophila]|uniref:DNA protecting protein DprA n=1 Tax=Fontimonas thermophila TaxID=1076937 RepID=A0A1I2H072_9GAMM|nr:DNA-processing protein DprA [Fontimonas thermophila]SFF22803.1 DNA protecting protein DprA [Fontimonas thermophila]